VPEANGTDATMILAGVLAKNLGELTTAVLRVAEAIEDAAALGRGEGEG